MSERNFPLGCSPYGPYSRAKLGWIDPIDVTDSLSDQTITDYMSTGNVFRLNFTPHEYFLVGNHKKAYPNTSRWEEKFPGQGLLIWHVDTTGDNCINYHKTVDLETADGLYDSLGGDPNDSTGLDSLDTDPLNNIGYYWCFFNNTTSQAFNDTSNPTTDGYKVIHLPNLWKQTVPTGISVNDIQGAGGGSMTADLFSPNPSIWWGPDTVYLTGDFTVESGSKLRIREGTVIVFDTTDDQQAGSDSSKCELIVQGKLEAWGTEQDTIHFLSVSSTPSDSDWYGVRVLPGGNAQLSYCDIRSASTGIEYVDSSTDTVTHCRFRNNHMYGLRIENSNVLVDECVIEKDWVGIDNSEGYGVLCHGADCTIKNTFFQGSLYGVKVEPEVRFIEPTPLIEECGFYNIGASGVLSVGSGPTIRKCCFKGVFGEAGIEVERGEATVTKCYMASEHDSIFIGMLFENGAGGTIHRTTIWDYDTCAVKIIGSTTDPDFGNSDSIGCNWFEEPDSGFKYFRSYSSSTILAKSAYWDVDDGDTSGIRDKIVGDVDIHPILGKCDHCFPYYSDQCSDLSPSDPEFEACKKAVLEDEREGTPGVFSVSQNYPNPFNPQTVIKYDLPRPAHVKLTIYNVLGQRVRTMVDEYQDAGGKTLFWDGTDAGGKEVASGVYFFWLRAGEFKAAKRMILMR